MKENQIELIERSPCWVAFIHPFTFVVPDEEKHWEVKLEDINNISYSSGNLVRIVTKVEIPDCDLPALICYDGAIAIPMNENFPSKETALNYFCNFYAKLLFSGFNIEGIDHKDIVNGNLHEKWAIWPTDLGESSISQTHSKIRMLVASNMDTIQLANPRIIKVSELKEKLKYGNTILDKIPNLTPKFLLRGITEFRYKNWDLVLSNLWITVEQLIDYLWHFHFLSNSSFHPVEEIPNRKKSMKEDSRTWSASVKQEILFQSNILNEEVLYNLNEARKTRNKLVHEGKAVSKETASSILNTTQLSLVCFYRPFRPDKIYQRRVSHSVRRKRPLAAQLSLVCFYRPFRPDKIYQRRVSHSVRRKRPLAAIMVTKKCRFEEI